MAQIVIPDEALIREPSLLVPGRKPVGPVRVDWGHPLARGLDLAYPMIGGLGNKSGPTFREHARRHFSDASLYAEDLGVGAALDLINDPSGAIYVNGGVNTAFAYRAGYIYVASSGAKAVTSVLTGAQIPTGASGESMTIAFSYWPNDTSDTSTMGLVTRSNEDCWAIRRESGDDLIFRTNGGNSGAFSNVLVQKTWNNIVFSWVVGSGHKLWINGVYIGFGANTNTSSPVPPYYFAIGDSSGGSALGVGDRFGHLFCWNRELSPSEAVSVSVDPYQFLIPA